MKNNYQLYQKIGLLLFFGIVTSFLLISGAAAVETGPRIIDDMYISPMYEEIIPIDDGKEIRVVEGWDYLKIWRQKIISELIGFFSDTILYEVIILLSPYIFALLGIFCIFRWTANKKREPSPYREKILTHIKEHPGSTQTQILAAMQTSRGTVCYHLNRLASAGKIHVIYIGRVPQYYPDAGQTIPENSCEYHLRYLISRKKSGRVLQTISQHPASTRKELADHLSLSPVTVRWYLRTFTKKELLIITKDGPELRYSFTDEAQHIYERLTQKNI